MIIKSIKMKNGHNLFLDFKQSDRIRQEKIKLTFTAQSLLLVFNVCEDH